MESIETGVTAFSPESTYRFVITSQSQKVKLTLEDLKSKKQWSSGYLDDKEYLTGTNKIPNASLSDYVKVFKDTLEYLMAKIDETKESKLQKLEPGKIRRKLIPVENDAMQLELSVKIKIFQNAWTAKYVFTLAPVALNRFDILEAKLRDVESELEEAKEDLEEEKQESAALGEELKQVKSKLAAVETTLASVQKKDSPVYLNASAKNTEKLNDKGQILLTSIQGVGFSASKDNSARGGTRSTPRCS